ncbi:unnamed protein product [Rhodiola kirilowii]
MSLRPMISVSPSASPSLVLSLLRNPPSPPLRRFSSPLRSNLNRSKELLNLRRRLRKVACRAELSPDAPFVVAIGACMLSSLVLPTAIDVGDDENSGIGSTDTRFAAMGVISFIPYFNWLGWVFAWLDSGKKRYAVYALVYLAPYFRSNLALSPEESWLPIASILFGIVHVQLEASIRNGDIQGFQLYSEATKHFPSMTRKKNAQFKSHQEKSEEDRESKQTNLPTGQKDDEAPWWGVTNKPKDPQQWKNDWDEEDHKRKD